MSTHNAQIDSIRLEVSEIKKEVQNMKKVMWVAAGALLANAGVPLVQALLA